MPFVLYRHRTLILTLSLHASRVRWVVTGPTRNIALTSCTFICYLYKVRAPPPDLDIHNVAGLLASHFSTTDPPSAASYHHSQAYPHSGFHYSSYGEPSPPQVYDHERRYPSRASRGGYGSMRPPSPLSYFSGGAIGMSNARPLETPRPLSIPSLLPTSPHRAEASARSTTEKGLIPHSTRLDSSAQDEKASPISPTESLEVRPMSGGSGSQAGSASNSAKREPSLVVIACRQWCVSNPLSRIYFSLEN